MAGLKMVGHSFSCETNGFPPPAAGLKEFRTQVRPQPSEDTPACPTCLGEFAAIDRCNSGSEVEPGGATRRIQLHCSAAEGSREHCRASQVRAKRRRSVRIRVGAHVRHETCERYRSFFSQSAGHGSLIGMRTCTSQYLHGIHWGTFLPGLRRRTFTLSLGISLPALIRWLGSNARLILENRSIVASSNRYGMR